jgi:hypothetical protein
LSEPQEPMGSIDYQFFFSVGNVKLVVYFKIYLGDEPRQTMKYEQSESVELRTAHSTDCLNTKVEHENI